MEESEKMSLGKTLIGSLCIVFTLSMLILFMGGMAKEAETVIKVAWPVWLYYALVYIIWGKK